MERYLQQLLSDIASASKNVSWPYAEKEIDIWSWVSPEEEDQIAPVRELEEWTGIKKEMLPPVEKLSQEQVHELLEALKKMLDAYNCIFVMQIEVPERVQYACIRDNFDQHVKVKQWHMGFFEYCKPGTEHGKCALGQYCHCAFFAELFRDMVDEEFSPEEERKRMLDIEVQHIKRKYGDDWMKYYPYHLDASYDDEDGNPYNYGFDDFDKDEEDDNWWRR
jgi:hypothetical protein